MEISVDDLKRLVMKQSQRIGELETRNMLMNDRVENLQAALAELQKEDDSEPDSRGAEAGPVVPEGPPS